MKGTCAPNTSNNYEETCYDSYALISMRNNWNKRNKDNIIDTTDPLEIWKKFKHILNDSCDIESCWLKNEAIRQDLDRDILNYTFSPEKPSSWEKKPYTWLNSNDIKNVMKQYENAHKNFKFIGPSPIDYDSEDYYDKETCVWPELCKFSLLHHIKNNVNTIGIIFNLDKHTESGSHWCCMFLDLRKKHLYYFDSYGKPIHINMKRLGNDILEQGRRCNTPLTFIKLKNEHQKKNSECGIYCLYFITSLLQEKHDYLHFENNRIPDDEIFKYRSVFFS